MRKLNKMRAGRFYDSSGRIISGLAIAALAITGFGMIPANTFAEGNCTVTYNSNIKHWNTTKVIPCGTTPGPVTVNGADGYTFSGNFTGPNGLMSADNVANSVVNGDVTYTAIMNGNKYCVTFRNSGTMPNISPVSQQCYTYEAGGKVTFDDGSKFKSQGYSVVWNSQVPLYGNYFFKQPFNFVISGSWSHNGSGSGSASRGGQVTPATVAPSSNNAATDGQTNNGTPLSSVDNPTGSSSASAKSSNGSSNNNGVSSPKTGVGEFALLDQNESPIAKIVGFGAAIVTVGAAIFLKRSKMRL